MNKDELKAVQVLKEAEMNRLKECAKKIEQTLGEYDAKILPEFLLLGNSVRSGYRVVSTRSDASLPMPQNKNGPEQG